jgi:FtsH-binding integral membrane protein
MDNKNDIIESKSQIEIERDSKRAFWEDGLVETLAPGLFIPPTLTLVITGQTVWLMWVMWGLSLGVSFWWYTRTRNWGWFVLMSSLSVFVAISHFIFSPRLTIFGVL